MSFSKIQLALLAESAMNMIGVISIYSNPSSMLTLLLPSTAVHTDALKSQTEWVAALTLGVTIPMLLCVPDRPGIASARNMLYITCGGFEAAMVGTALAQYIRGNSGFTDNALLGTMATFTLFTLERVLFCYLRPSWLEPQDSAEAKDRKSI